MKIKIGSKKSFVFVFIIGVILGVMTGLLLINNKKEIADKNYIDSQKQKLDIENRVNENKVQNIIKENEIKKENPDPEEMDNLKVVPTVLDDISGNTAYCPTFQLVWNEMLDLHFGGKEAIPVGDGHTLIDNLNVRTFEKEDISENYYYIKVGKQLVSVKKEIEKNIKDKFNETSDVLDFVYWEDDSKVDFENFKDEIFYAMLKREFKFENPFDIVEEDGTFEEYMNVTYFGIDDESTDSLRNQVDVLYYDNKQEENEYAVRLNTKENDEIILLKNDNDEFDNFEEVYNSIINKENAYSGKKVFTEEDFLKVPNIKFNVLKNYNELLGKTFRTNSNELKTISAAMQTIKFEINNEGGKIKSEALMALTLAAVIEDDVKENRYFNFDSDFYMFLKEKGKDKPYFALKVDDISVFQEDAKKMRFYEGKDLEAEAE